MKPYYWLIFILLVGCGPARKCPQQLSEVKYMEGLARLHIPISVDKENFENYVNSKIPDTLYADEDAGGQNIELVVLKTGRPSVDLNGRTSTVVIPMEIKAERDLGFLKARADGKMFMTLVSVIEIDTDWKLTTRTSVEKLDWVKEPRLKMAGLSMSVKGMVERMIFSTDNQLAGQLDQIIDDEQPLVNMINGLMPQFERSYPLDPDGRYYLQVIPNSAGIASFVENSERLSSQATIEATAYLLQDSNSIRTEVPRPFFEWADNKSSNYDLTTHLSFKDDEIEKLIRESLIGESFRFRKKDVKIDQVYFDLQDKKVKVDAHISGGIKGVLHFEGTPYWKDDEIAFCDQSVDISIRYGVSKFLLWLFRSQIERIISKKIEQSMNEEIDKRIEEINSYLGDFQPSEKVRIEAEIFDHAIDPVSIYDRRLELGINLNVRGAIFFEELELLIE
ncbi:MAG: DUF4403 family protein [Saprospiraceae bacterium]|nr:DUF4403 family protein [Saprospiraceae bacterium]